MRPGEQRLPEDESGHAGVAQPAHAGEVCGTAGDEDVDVVAADEGLEQAGVRRAHRRG